MQADILKNVTKAFSVSVDFMKILWKSMRAKTFRYLLAFMSVFLLWNMQADILKNVGNQV